MRDEWIKPSKCFIMKQDLEHFLLSPLKHGGWKVQFGIKVGDNFKEQKDCIVFNMNRMYPDSLEFVLRSPTSEDVCLCLVQR